MCQTKLDFPLDHISHTMVNFKVLAAAFAVGSVFDGANAHPGENHSAAHVKREIERYSSAHAQVARAFSRIHEFPHAVVLKERAIARRFATWNALREKRGITSSQFIPYGRSRPCCTNLYQSLLLKKEP
jgi:hypothetical protein